MRKGGSLLPICLSQSFHPTRDGCRDSLRGQPGGQKEERLRTLSHQNDTGTSGLTLGSSNPPSKRHGSHHTTFQAALKVPRATSEQPAPGPGLNQRGLGGWRRPPPLPGLSSWEGPPNRVARTLERPLSQVTRLHLCVPGGNVPPGELRLMESDPEAAHPPRLQMS